MSISKPLHEIKSKYWGNAILFRLAEALGKTPKLEGDVANPDVIYEVVPDDILDEALEVIWRYRELSK